MADLSFSPTVIDLCAYARRKAETHIWRAKHSPSEMKELVMLAYERRWLTAAQAEDWIVLSGLEAA
jgi:hypothetical protein